MWIMATEVSPQILRREAWFIILHREDHFFVTGSLPNQYPPVGG
jgi:hypothetical protein